MELENAWKKFICSGSPQCYIDYCYLKQQKEKNNADNKGASDKSNGGKG